MGGGVRVEEIKMVEGGEIMVYNEGKDYMEVYHEECEKGYKRKEEVE